jgi:hypothetical protein
VNAVVIYESLTGNTRTAAHLIGEHLEVAGMPTTVCPITDIDYQALHEAELVVVGSWTDGLFIIGQRPGRASRLRKMPVITGKRAVVYCTYALDPGKTLDKLSAIVADRGGDMLGGLAIRRDNLVDGSHEFVDRLLGALEAS